MSGPRDGNGPNLSPLRFAGAGIELILPVLVATYIGYRLDRWLETSPWFLVGMAVLGIVTGFVQFFRSVLPSRGDGEDGDSRGGA